MVFIFQPVPILLTGEQEPKKKSNHSSSQAAYPMLFTFTEQLNHPSITKLGAIGLQRMCLIFNLFKFNIAYFAKNWIES